MRLVSAIYNDFHPFDQLPFVNEFLITSDPADLKEGDLLVVWGGSDISPSLYGKEVSHHTGANDYPSRRDSIEWALMQRAKELAAPIIGVCRGAQMLCALAGGYLIQDIDNHFGSHQVVTPDGTLFETNSIHHQMMYPWGIEHELLASVPEQLSRTHIDVEKNVEVPLEPEYVYFPTVQGFAIQWHPEAMSAKSNATQYIFKTIEERLNVK